VLPTKQADGGGKLPSSDSHVTQRAGATTFSSIKIYINTQGIILCPSESSLRAPHLNAASCSTVAWYLRIWLQIKNLPKQSYLR